MLEKFQRKVLRWVIRSEDYETLSKLNFYPICYQIARADLILLWKTWHGTMESNIKLHVNTTTLSSRGSVKTFFEQPLNQKFKTDNCFLSRTIQAANYLISINFIDFRLSFNIFCKNLDNFLIAKTLFLTTIGHVHIFLNVAVWTADLNLLLCFVNLHVFLLLFIPLVGILVFYYDYYNIKPKLNKLTCTSLENILDLFLTNILDLFLTRQVTRRQKLRFHFFKTINFKVMKTISYQLKSLLSLIYNSMGTN